MDGSMNLFFPLWMDGGLGKELHAGARALRDYLSGRFSFTEVPVDESCSPVLKNGIFGYDAIRSHLARARDILADSSPERIFTIGGGCGIEVPIVSNLRRRLGPMRLLWFDAHGDINSPASSKSKYFHGMPLRFLLEPSLDEGIGAGSEAVDPGEIVLVGSRDLDPPEEEYIRERGIRRLGPREAGAALNPGSAPVYIHLDLDVLDPEEYPNVKCPSREGMRIAEVASIVGSFFRVGPVSGMSVVENTATDEATISRLEPIFEAAAKAFNR
jgi:arginase